MNTPHYPSLELCKKLTESGFPRTEIDIDKDWCLEKDWAEYKCPSVMELLDEIPCSVTLLKKSDWTYSVNRNNPRNRKHTEWKTASDALAEMYLWLKENNYLP